MSQADGIINDYECVEPDVGAQMWRYDVPDLDPEIKVTLNDHLDICAACRIERALLKRLDEGFARRKLRLRADPPAWLQVNVLATSGGFAMAAGLALLLMLPPSSSSRDFVQRAGNSESGFRRPVAGEVILDRTPKLSWASLDGASSYRVVLQETGGSYSWTGETSDTALEVPATQAVPRSTDIRALLEPIPSDLASPGEFSVTFRREAWPRFLAYRLRTAPPIAGLCGLLGACLGLAAVLLRLRNR